MPRNCKDIRHILFTLGEVHYTDRQADVYQQVPSHMLAYKGHTEVDTKTYRQDAHMRTGEGSLGPLTSGHIYTKPTQKLNSVKSSAVCVWGGVINRLHHCLLLGSGTYMSAILCQHYPSCPMWAIYIDTMLSEYKPACGEPSVSNSCSQELYQCGPSEWWQPQNSG